MFRVTRSEIHTLYSLRSGGESKTRRRVTYTQPPFWYVAAKIYHFYDMKVFRLPGFKKLEDWYEKRNQDNPFYVPISAQQDLRCYQLTERGRIVLKEEKL